MYALAAALPLTSRPRERDDALRFVEEADRFFRLLTPTVAEPVAWL